jgi:hypothetical protein
LVHRWIASVGLDDTAYGTHTMRRTNASLIYRRTKNLRSVQLLLGYTKLESTVRYLGIEWTMPLKWSSKLKYENELTVEQSRARPHPVIPSRAADVSLEVVQSHSRRFIPTFTSSDRCSRQRDLERRRAPSTLKSSLSQCETRDIIYSNLMFIQVTASSFPVLGISRFESSASRRKIAYGMGISFVRRTGGNGWGNPPMIGSAINPQVDGWHSCAGDLRLHGP